MTFVIRQETPFDDFAAESLVKKVFGPGRFAKSAYRFRDSQEDIAELAFVAENHLGHIVGTIRYWDFSVSDKIILLGPIAIEKGLRNMGLGENLMYVSLEKAKNMGYVQVVLVGDYKYYQRFGFTHDMADNIRFGYPINPERLLARFL